MARARTRSLPELEKAVYALVERICDVGQEVLDLEEDPTVPAAAAAALPSAAVILAAAARTLLNPLRNDVPREGQVSARVRRSRVGWLEWRRRTRDRVDLEKRDGPEAVGRRPPARVLSRGDPLPPYQ